MSSKTMGIEEFKPTYKQMLSSKQKIYKWAMIQRASSDFRIEGPL